MYLFDYDSLFCGEKKPISSLHFFVDFKLIFVHKTAIADGNLVVYGGSPYRSLWATGNTGGTGPYSLVR
jgi:hypothetical protein